MTTPPPTDNETSRLEAFSDGVFAIAITLLVLQMKPPPAASQTPLYQNLVNLWPAYWGFVVSFLTILVMWVNHHRLFKLVVRTDDWLLMFNGLLLLCITFIPFPTSVLAEHLAGHERRTAALFYTGTLVAVTFFYNVLWWCVAHRDRLIDRSVNHQRIRAITITYALGPFIYGLAAALAFFNVALCLSLTLIAAAYYLIPLERRKIPRPPLSG